MLVLGFDAGLFLIDAETRLEDRIRECAQEADPKLQIVVLDFEGVNYIDSQGSETLGAILDLTRSHSAELRLARVKPAVMDVLRRDGVVERIGAIEHPRQPLSGLPGPHPPDDGRHRFGNGDPGSLNGG